MSICKRAESWVGKFKRNSGRRKQGCKEKEEPRREGWNLKKETQIQNQYQYQGEEHRGTEGSEKRLGFEGGARNNKVLEYPRYHHFFSLRAGDSNNVWWARPNRSAGSGEGRNGYGCVFLAACQVFTHPASSSSPHLKGRKQWQDRAGGV